MPSIVVDAGPLIALFRRSDRHHQAARLFLERHEASSLVTNLLVVGEVAAVLGASQKSLAACLTWIVDNIEIDAEAAADMPRAIEIIGKYRDLPADLADASLVALCERRGLSTMASINDDFEVYRMSRNRRLMNVFFAGS